MQLIYFLDIPFIDCTSCRSVLVLSTLLLFCRHCNTQWRHECSIHTSGVLEAISGHLGWGMGRCAHRGAGRDGTVKSLSVKTGVPEKTAHAKSSLYN